MSSKDQNLSDVNSKNLPFGKGLKIHISVSEWNSEITDSLLESCKSCLLENGLAETDIEIVRTPGSFELPFAAKLLIEYNNPDAVICLGCVIKGETQHDEFINNAIALSISQLGIVTNTPVIFGVLTVNDMQQALDRSGGKYGNKGEESAQTAIKMVYLKKGLKKAMKKIGF